MCQYRVMEFKKQIIAKSKIRRVGFQVLARHLKMLSGLLQPGQHKIQEMVSWSKRAACKELHLQTVSKVVTLATTKLRTKERHQLDLNTDNKSNVIIVR